MTMRSFVCFVALCLAGESSHAQWMRLVPPRRFAVPAARFSPPPQQVYFEQPVVYSAYEPDRTYNVTASQPIESIHQTQQQPIPNLWLANPQTTRMRMQCGPNGCRMVRGW